MANYDYSSYSASSSGGAGDANALFSQADANKDGSIDRNEFASFVGGAGALGGAAGGAGGGYGGSSYESSSFSSSGDAGFGGFGGAGGVGGGSYESSSFSSGAGLDAAALGGGASFQSSSFESAGGADLSSLSQAASYTAQSNAEWSRYGAEVRGAGLYVDSNPQIIRRQAPGGVQTYTQNIRVRFLQPPPVPPPGVSFEISF